MASLCGFRNDLIIEQEHGSDIQPKVSIPTKAQNLGHAFLVLFQATRSAVRRAIANLDADNVLSSSIRGFVTHVEVAGQSPRQDDSEAITRMQEVYRPLLDKIMKKSDDSGKKIAYLLSDWLLLEYPYRHLMAHSLSLDFGPQADKRLKLASILAIEHSFNTYTKNGASPNRHSAVSKSGEITADQLSDLDQTATSIPIFRDIDVITEWSTHLANVVLHDGTVSADGHRTMTRLTGLALGLYMSFSKLLAAQALEEVKMASTEPKQPTLVVDTDTTGNSVHTGPKPLGWGFVLCMIDMYRVVKDMQEWSGSGPSTRLIVASLGDIADMISRFNRHQGGDSTDSWPAILASFARIWEIISLVLSQASASPPSPKLLQLSLTYAKNEDIPPYLRLVLASVFLGYRMLSSSIDFVLQTDDMGLVLLGHATFIVSERIPVGNKCAAVIRDFTLPLMSDVNIAQIWSLISPVLDRPVELDYSTLVVIAQYVITRPTILIPEIFRYLTTPEVRTTSEQDRAVAVKNRNLLGVASALGDLDFFNLPMDQKADSDRSVLADKVIGFLYDRDLASRMTANHVVASLDPVRTIQTFAPDLASPDRDVRSTGEIILIDCMLSQRQDESIGDGLACFIEYTRSIARGGEAVSTDDRRELLKNPSQLMSVFKRTSPRALSSSKSSVSEEQLLAVLKRMGGAIPPPVWPSVIHVILSKLEGSPSDLTLVRIWTLLASSIVTSREAIAASYRSISMMLERQGDVTEAMLEAAMEVSDEGLDDLRMSRVLPFKILKTFDVLKKSGHDTSLYESIRPLLKSRINNIHEFSRVQQLARQTMEELFQEPK